MRPMVLAAGTMALAAVALGAVDPGLAVAPRTEFSPPQPGTYNLQKIQRVGEATLLEPSGQPVRLSAVTTGKITLLTFFYIHCADPLGCPLAYSTLMNIRSELLGNARLANRVRIVSVSLDPSNDTPAAIDSYRSMIPAASSVEWRVLTARSLRELLPVLDDFGQDVSVEQGADGKPRRTVHHMLKMFLIDKSGVVREIYSSAFLQRAVILNDIQTLYLEEGMNPAASHPRVVRRRASLSGP
jgi:protein SCO1